MNQNPESLEGRREILYRDYPEVYEEFAQGTYRFIHSKASSTISESIARW
jgi:hypothetical protein